MRVVDICAGQASAPAAPERTRESSARSDARSFARGMQIWGRHGLGVHPCAKITAPIANSAARAHERWSSPLHPPGLQGADRKVQDVSRLHFRQEWVGL